MSEEQQSLTLEPTATLEGPIQTTATIVAINRRTVEVGEDEPAVYLDFKFKVDHDELSQIVNEGITAGFPARLSPDTLLGKLVKRLGGDPTQETDFNSFLGQQVNLLCDKQESPKDGKSYWRIERSSITRT